MKKKILYPLLALTLLLIAGNLILPLFYKDIHLPKLNCTPDDIEEIRIVTSYDAQSNSGIAKIITDSSDINDFIQSWNSMYVCYPDILRGSEPAPGGNVLSFHIHFKDKHVEYYRLVSWNSIDLENKGIYHVRYSHNQSLLRLYHRLGMPTQKVTFEFE
ncbi:hypothetical protein [Anaerolentibacter hominis]|uniref:hypothetical protein n=1 Tax=Anaerolentibacter hominis TaxID=3079009 RepID=UPI0031B87FFE